MGNLLNSFEITDLDLENSNPTGLFRLDTITQYGPLVTGAPALKVLPGTGGSIPINPGPARNFFQDFIPNSTYLEAYKRIIGYSKIENIFDLSNIESLSSFQDPTSYPQYITGTPTTRANPGPFNKFKQTFNPENVYLINNPIRGRGRLRSTVANTNLDVENSRVDGGIPYKEDKDPTSYPETVTGTPTTKSNPGPFSKFKHSYEPQNTYLDEISNNSEGRLISTVANTNLDVENKLPNGGIPYKTDKDPTAYPKRVTGTPTADGPGAPEKFYQEYNPQKEYLDEVGEGILDLSFDSTNFDVENEYPDGGIPYKTDKDPTSPKNDLTTGPPLRDGIPGPFNKFNQKYNPKTTYLLKNPIKTIESTLSEWGVPGLNSDPKVLKRTLLDDASTFQYESYVRNLNLPETYRKGSNLLHFITETDSRNNQRRVKYDVYDITRLDRESPLSGKVLENTNAFIFEGITGGVPYKPNETDPTIYPVTSLKVGSVKGYNGVTGRAATKYTEPYDPPVTKDDRRTGFSNRKPTYLEYIKNFI